LWRSAVAIPSACTATSAGGRRSRHRGVPTDPTGRVVPHAQVGAERLFRRCRRGGPQDPPTRVDPACPPPPRRLLLRAEGPAWAGGTDTAVDASNAAARAAKRRARQLKWRVLWNYDEWQWSTILDNEGKNEKINERKHIFHLCNRKNYQ
jgi:hypothetical protein